jgi:hypothetical protein
MGQTAPYKMIAIDLDGTLLSPEGTVTERSKAAIHAALAAGLLVCFATGRNWTESRAVIDAVEHYATAVFVGGAMVIDTERHTTLHRTLMQPDLAAELCEFLESQGHAVLALQDTDTAGVDYLISENAPLSPATSQWMETTRAAFRMAPSLAHVDHQHTIRVGIVADTAQADRVAQALAERFGDRVLLQSIAVPFQDVNVLEIFDPAVNKWEGVLHIARHHGISPQQIVAIGDDVNDIPMLRNAGLGVAMGNARPAIQAIAKRVIGHHKDEGLAEFLEQLVAEHAVQPLGELTPAPGDRGEQAA